LVSLIKKHSSYAVCTVLGAGYFPFAPGTFASILAAILVYLLQPQLFILSLAIIFAFSSGIIFSKEVEKNDGKDPKHVVIDEVAGQWITFLFIVDTSFIIIISGLFLFRGFDILKPFGINRIQDKENGWGVMLDDILAGIYSNIILQILIIAGLIQ